MKVAAGHKVTLEYEIKVKGGEVIEKSSSTGPLVYTQGEGKLLPGLEKRLLDAPVGKELRGEIPSAEVFGSEESFPTTEIPRSGFPKDAKLEVGSMFEGKAANGTPVAFKVTKLDDTTVTVRLLPIIAGKDLEFRARVLAIEDPVTKKRVAFMPPPPAAALKINVEDE